jgi:mannose-6-phosphate isomerase
MTRSEIFASTEETLKGQRFRIVAKDDTRPWGGFYCLDETQVVQFVSRYFDSLNASQLMDVGKLSPKILLVAPSKRLSWQYHLRRAEIWQVVQGPIGVITSVNDTENEPKIYQPKDQIQLRQGERHRLVGLAEWGVVAEIWRHTDPSHPTDEDDIIRLQDDYGRSE